MTYICRRDWRKSGICGNAKAITEMEINDISLTTIKFWEKAHHKKQILKLN
jgi:hypothetical protein